MRPRASALVLAAAAAVLAANAHAAPIVVADSVADFSDTQGQDNWYYGYYTPWDVSDFTWLSWSGTQWGSWPDTPLLWADGGHPKAIDPRWAVRRWVAEVSGLVMLDLDLRKRDTGGGNGVSGRVLLDGVEVWSQTIGGTDGTGVQTSLPLMITAGQTLDLAIGALGDENYDSTIFTARITIAVPEPGSLGALALSLLALPIGWRAARARRRAARPAAGRASS